MTERADKSADAAGTVPLAQVEAQAEGVRGELERLGRELASLRREMSAERALQLQQANERLVLAALHAESIADAAVSSLAEMSRSLQRDALTGTPNRALTLDRLERAIALARRHGTQVAVLFIDVDCFKQINDEFGHSVGDATLELVARRLESVVRTSDTVCRYGGDEFMVLIPEILETRETGIVAEKIRKAFSAPATVDGHEFDISVSIGVAVYPQDGTEARVLIDRADSAMYSAKQHVGTRVGVFDAEASGGRNRRATATLVPSSGPGPAGAHAEQSLQMQQLREANERLVLGALTSQERRERDDARHRRQAEFVAMVAHELRNPLNPIRNAAELLKRARSDQALLENLQGIIERQVVQMARLIDDLLDGARAGFGKLRVQLASVDLLEVLRVAVDGCRPAMQARHQQLALHLPEGPVGLQADQFRLAQVFSNLLENASKYTPEGGRITLSLVTQADTAVVSVADDGVGITPGALPHVFELFVQDERAQSAQSRGLGIGLAVVRELVEAHGGSVTASSPGVGRGSQFVVRLPVHGPMSAVERGTGAA